MSRQPEFKIVAAPTVISFDEIRDRRNKNKRGILYATDPLNNIGLDMFIASTGVHFMVPSRFREYKEKK